MGNTHENQCSFIILPQTKPLRPPLPEPEPEAPRPPVSDMTWMKNSMVTYPSGRTMTQERVGGRWNSVWLCVDLRLKDRKVHRFTDREKAVAWCRSEAPPPRMGPL